MLTGDEVCRKYRRIVKDLKGRFTPNQSFVHEPLRRSPCVVICTESSPPMKLLSTNSVAHDLLSSSNVFLGRTGGDAFLFRGELLL